MCAAAEGQRTFCSLHQIEFLRVTEQYLFQQPLTALRRCMPVISCLKSEEHENLSNCVDFFYTAARRTGTECLPYKLVRGKRLHRPAAQCQTRAPLGCKGCRRRAAQRRGNGNENLRIPVVQAAPKRHRGAIAGVDASDVGDGGVAIQASVNVIKLK